MGLPTPGKERKRRKGSFRHMKPAKQSHRSVVSTLLTTNRPDGSHFFVFEEETDEKMNDTNFLETRRAELRRYFGEETGWYNVDEHNDATIWCTCGKRVAVSMKILALRARMAQLGHIPAHSDIGEAFCPKCGDTTVLNSGLMIMVASLTTGHGIPVLLEKSLIRVKLVKRLEFNGDVYGPEWLKGVTIPTLKLSEGSPRTAGEHAKVFSTTVKDLRNLVEGRSVFEDEDSMSYMRHIPVIGHNEGYFVVDEEEWVNDDYTHIILKGLLTGRQPNQKIFITASQDWGSWKGFRVYFDEKYLNLGLYYHTNYFEWRDEIG